MPRRGLIPYEERKQMSDCTKGKHLWLVNRLERRDGSPSAQTFFKIYGRCALCPVKGESDLLVREQLPVTEDFFTKLNPVRATASR